MAGHGGKGISLILDVFNLLQTNDCETSISTFNSAILPGTLTVNLAEDL